MQAFALFGFLVIAAIVIAGFYWVITNVTFRKQPERYIYVKDEDGNEYVKDNKDA